MAKRKAKVPAKRYEPTEAEVAAVTEHAERRKVRPRAPAVQVMAVKGKVVEVAPDHPDAAVWTALIAKAFGTAERSFADMMLNQVLNIAAPGSELDKGIADGILAALHGIEPRDELEGMLATQMVATHIATMECLRRAGLKEQNFEARTMNLQQANKLARTYAAQLEALNRHRGKGQQKMTVEHVHIYDGGRAIVGPVNRSNRGEGVPEKSEEQPYAKALADAPEPALRSADPQGDTLPSAGGTRETAMQDAQRREGQRRAQGQ